MIEYILFDAANTLIYKPSLWIKMDEVLKKNGYHISLKELKFKHKILSEFIKFPDVTNEEFYNLFNKELLNSLGIIESEKLLHDIFHNCKYLDWKAFDDTRNIPNYDCEVGVLSNFNLNLTSILNQTLPSVKFKHVFISEKEKVAKPNLLFFEKAIDKIGLPPQKILYIGDSLKLDIIPALKMGLNVKLIDRDNVYLSSKYRLDTLQNIKL